MKILIVDVNYGHSSTGKIVKDLQAGIVSNGSSALICYGRGAISDDPHAVRVASPLEVYSHVALSRVTGRTGGFSPFSTRKVIELIDRYAPDVVHLHELHGYYLNISEIVQYLKDREIPTVWTFHCEFMYTGKCGYAYECEQWKTECVSCPQVREYPASWLLDRTNVMFHEKMKLLADFKNLQIITPSSWLADRVRQSFLGDKRIDVIYNGIDTASTFVRRPAIELREQHDIKTRHVIVSIAPDLMSDRKGGKWVLEIAKRLANQDITFVMVGVEKPNEISMPNVVALPRVGDQNLLARYYSLGDFFLLTSRKETFSLVCAESLACGTPIIGFDSGAPTEVAPPGYGSFVEYGDLDALCSSLLAGLENREAFRSSEECTTYAVRNFGKDAMVAAYLETYYEACRAG